MDWTLPIRAIIITSFLPPLSPPVLAAVITSISLDRYYNARSFIFIHGGDVISSQYLS